MRKLRRTLNRLGNKNKGLLALMAVALTLMVWWWPHGGQDAIESTSDADFWKELLGGVGLDNLTANETAREVQIKYQSGGLENLGVVEAGASASGTFDAVGTAASGSAAKFELICGTKVCGSNQDVFQEPLTYWVVSIPPTIGLTKLTVTAGAAYLEVAF